MGSGVALRAVAFQLAVGAGGAHLAVDFQLAMRARVAVRAVAFQLPVGAGVAVCAFAFQPAVRLGVAFHAIKFPLPVRAGVALRAVAFQLPVGAGIALRAVVFLLPMRAPFPSHRVSLRRYTGDSTSVRVRLLHPRNIHYACVGSLGSDRRSRHESARARRVVRSGHVTIHLSLESRVPKLFWAPTKREISSSISQRTYAHSRRAACVPPRPRGSGFGRSPCRSTRRARW